MAPVKPVDVLRTGVHMRKRTRRERNFVNVRTAALSSASASLQSHKAKIAVAVALAVEWALAFAFARRFADAVAEANALYADEFDVQPRIDDLARRVGALELDHGYSSHHEPGPPRSRKHEAHRERTGIDEGIRD